MGRATNVGESMLQLPRVGWRLLASSPDCIIVVVMEMTLTHVSVHTRKIQKRARLATNSCKTAGLTPGSSTPRRQRHSQALDDEELFIIEGSPTAKTGAQLRDNPEEREKCRKNDEKPFIAPNSRKATSLCCELGCPPNQAMN